MGVSMKLTSLLKDPFYANIMYVVESTIHKIDLAAQEEGIRLTDSNVKSALRKALGIVKGKKPTLPNTSEKDELLKELVLNLVKVGAEIEMEYENEYGSVSVKSLSKNDWALVLRGVEESLKTRREMHGHSRGYLDFLAEFVRDAQSERSRI